MLSRRRNQPTVEVDPPQPVSRVAVWAPDHVNVPVTGEAGYQDNLRRLTGRRGMEALAVEHLPATLIHDPEHPYDEHAIRVVIEGLTVGYVAPGKAQTYCGRLKAAIANGWAPQVGTWIGCRGEGHLNSDIGVRLKVPCDSPLEQPA